MMMAEQRQPIIHTIGTPDDATMPMAWLAGAADNQHGDPVCQSNLESQHVSLQAVDSATALMNRLYNNTG